MWAGTCALSTEVVVVEKWVTSAYDLETAKEEEALSSLIEQLDSTCITYLIWLRVGATTVERVLTKNKAVSSAWRVWIRHWAAQISGALVSKLHTKIWRV